MYNHDKVDHFDSHKTTLMSVTISFRGQYPRILWAAAEHLGGARLNTLAVPADSSAGYSPVSPSIYQSYQSPFYSTCLAVNTPLRSRYAHRH